MGEVAAGIWVLQQGLSVFGCLIDRLAGYIKHTAASGVRIASDGSISIYMHHHFVVHKWAENV